MRIGIMGAMREEIEPILELVDEISGEIDYGKNRYYKAHYYGVELIIAYSKIGKVNSALTASTMIEKFEIDILLFSGVAGAINSNLHIGDLIIATKLCQHDLDITAFGHPFGYVPEGSVYVTTNEKLKNIESNIIKEVLKNLEIIDKLNDKEPHIHFCHISTKEGLNLITNAKNRFKNVKITSS